ncbi:IS66 family insertion sequence element accessory protein TnpA [Marininema halotolerans]|uniref:Transposase n=1 Tax=Marininema halotolerans TaxID=1155944 RepID=A0A1I6PYJ5_9BACL|nr:hypothetical protein [Marininema halotolerans]SFS45287.1 hypothetical protein SAMN05444972_102224 [Marininema halotolerans]
MTRTEKRKAWEARVASFQASGQSVPPWCAVHEIKEHQLRYWLKKAESIKATAFSSQWMPIEVGEHATGALTIRLGAATIEVESGFDPVLLTDVVKVLSDVH